MRILKNILGITALENRVETLESLILNQESKKLGFAVLKSWLNDPKKPLPKVNNKDITD